MSLPDICEVNISGLPSADQKQMHELIGEIRRLLAEFKEKSDPKQSAILYCSKGIEKWRLAHYRRGHSETRYVGKGRSEALARLQTRLHKDAVAQVDFFRTFPRLNHGNSFKTCVKLYEFIFAEYFSLEPWRQPGWEWDTPHAVFTTIAGVDQPNDYRQINIQINKKLAVLVQAEAGQKTRSVAAFCATVIGWGIRYLLPELARKSRG